MTNDILMEFEDIINKQAKSVWKKSHHYVRSRIDLDDLISEGTLIAMQVYPKYDPERDKDIKRYMGIQIRFGLLRFVESNTFDLNVPYSAMYKASLNGEGKDFLYQNTALRIVDGDEFHGGMRVITEDGAMFASGDMPTIDKLEASEDINILHDEISKLDKDEKTVLQERYLGNVPLTKESVAFHINSNPVTVTAIENRAKDKLRSRIRDRHRNEFRATRVE